MALPSTGGITAAMINIELGRAASAPFSMNGTAERALAGKPTGAVSFGDFRGKSSEIVKTLSSGGAAITLQSLFTPEEWTAASTKRVLVPAGVERGTSVLAEAISIGTSGWGGTLSLEVSGTISGIGGAPSGGTGGNAVNANIGGLSGQKLLVLVMPSGVIRAGGGGGGKGGDGGSGQLSGTARQPASGASYSLDPATYLLAEGEVEKISVFWEGVALANQVSANNTLFTTSLSGQLDNLSSNGSGITANTKVFRSPQNGGDYYIGSYQATAGADKGRYSLYRNQAVTETTLGGLGGNGGRGEGYDGARAEGSAGAVGATNAGAGGAGGRGGLYGASGLSGLPGASGTLTGGAAGASGGLAGYAIYSPAHYTLTNSGSVQGRL